MDRRTWLRDAAAAVAAIPLVSGARRRDAAAGPAQTGEAPRPSEGTPGFFPGFKPFKVAATGATINGVIGGSGPPLLLLHGAPQTHVSWRLVAPKLAESHTVVAADLRGYGDSSAPPDGEGHANYAKRAMALDQVEVMHQFGFDRFRVIGHDRGGRVGQRMALDHPAKVTGLAVLDIVPTHYLYTHVTIDFVQAYFHWFNYLQPSPIPENQLLAQRPPGQPSAAQLEYQRRNGTPEGVHAMCEDYRAGASIDLAHDGADFGKKLIRCPVNALWAEGGAMDKIYDVLAIWKSYAKRIEGKGMPGGHNMQEGAPKELLAELQ